MTHTPMAEWSGVAKHEMIQPEDLAEIVRLCLRLSPHARIPEIVVENTGGNTAILSRGDVLNLE